METKAGQADVSITQSVADDAPGERFWATEEKKDGTQKVIETVSKNQTSLDAVGERLDKAATKQQAEKAKREAE